MLPEERAREKIDKQLTTAGWDIVSRDEYVPQSASAVKESLMLGNTESDYLLFVDDKAALDTPLEVVDEQGSHKTLRTVGAKWSYLESHKFGANAQPFYVIVDPATGRPLTGSRAYDEDADSYLDWLNQGLRH